MKKVAFIMIALVLISILCACESGETVIRGSAPTISFGDLLGSDVQSP